MTARAKRKFAALAINLLGIGLLLLGASRSSYANAAGHTVVMLYLVWIAVLSIHRVRDSLSGRLWDRGTFLGKYWRWITDDYPH